MNYQDISPVISEFLLSKNIDSQCSVKLAGSAGSLRYYYRIQQDDVTYILMVSPADDGDFGRFLRLTQFYRLLEFPVPRVFCIDDKFQQVLLEDLGNSRLYDAVKVNTGDIHDLYRKAVDLLVFLQTHCYQRYLECPDISSRIFDHRDLLWETSYFKTEYLVKYRNVQLSDKDERTLENEFKKLADAVELQTRTVMHRDLQSQNIMVQNDQLRIIDYQGSRLGSLYYDLASLLLDPYTMLDDKEIEDVFIYYHSKSLTQLKPDESYHQFLLAGAQRIMQALGAFCFLYGTKGLTAFKSYIPSGEARLKWVLERAELDGIRDVVL